MMERSRELWWKSKKLVKKKWVKMNNKVLLKSGNNFFSFSLKKLNHLHLSISFTKSIINSNTWTYGLILFCCPKLKLQICSLLADVIWTDHATLLPDQTTNNCSSKLVSRYSDIATDIHLSTTYLMTFKKSLKCICLFTIC